MPKTLTRLFTLLLVACLIVDPVTATTISPAVRGTITASPTIYQSHFDQQALIEWFATAVFPGQTDARPHIHVHQLIRPDLLSGRPFRIGLVAATLIAAKLGFLPTSLSVYGSLVFFASTIDDLFNHLLPDAPADAFDVMRHQDRWGELSERDQRVLHGRFLEGMTLEALAEELHITPSAVAGRVIRAISRLQKRAKLEGWGPASDHTPALTPSTAAGVDPTLRELGERWLGIVEKAGSADSPEYEKLLEELQRRLASSPHGGQYLMTYLRMEYHRKSDEEWYVIYMKPIPVDAQIVLKGFALYLDDRSFERGFSGADLHYLENLIQRYNACPEVRLPHDIPSLFVTALSSYFKDEKAIEAYRKLSFCALNLPEPHRSWAAALELFLAGTHRDYAIIDSKDDYLYYPTLLNLAFEQLKKPMEDAVVTLEVRNALIVGLGRFLAFMGPFVAEGYRKGTHVVVLLTEEEIMGIHKTLGGYHASVSNHYLSGILEGARAASADSVPGQELLIKDPLLNGFDVLVFTKAVDLLTAGMGRSPVTMTRLFLDRSNEPANQYLNRLLQNILDRRAKFAKVSARYDIDTAYIRQLDLTLFLRDSLIPRFTFARVSPAPPAPVPPVQQAEVRTKAINPLVVKDQMAFFGFTAGAARPITPEAAALIQRFSHMIEESLKALITVYDKWLANLESSGRVDQRAIGTELQRVIQANNFSKAIRRVLADERHSLNYRRDFEVFDHLFMGSSFQQAQRVMDLLTLGEELSPEIIASRRTQIEQLIKLLEAIKVVSNPAAVSEKPEPNGFMVSELLVSQGVLFAGPLLAHMGLYPAFSQVLEWIVLMVRTPPVHWRPQPFHTPHLLTRHFLSLAA